MLNRFKFARNREKLLARADVVFDAYRQGWIMPNIAVVLPLSEAAEVHRLLKTGKEFMAKVYEANDEAQDALETTIQANLNQAIDLVLKENRLVLEKVNYPAIAQLTQTITRSQRIFVAGEGRSGLVIRMVAMRLMHLGYQVYVVGETTTPSIVECDLLILPSRQKNTYFSPDPKAIALVWTRESS